MDRKLLARATESTDAPTPGYMYLDIAKNASSSPSACQEIAQYLTRKLASKQHHNIKYKCCKVIGKLAEQVSRGQFKRCIIQDPTGVTAIKEAMNFRGPPDPVLGDEIYARVRSAAKEALDAVYADNPTSSEQQTNAYNAAAGGGVPGGSYGTPSHFQHSHPQQHHAYGGSGGGGGGGGGGGSRMQGIGNPMFSDPRLEPDSGGIKDIMRDVGESFVGMIKDPLARNVDVPPYPRGDPRNTRHSGGLPGYGNNNNNMYGRPPPGSAELSYATNGEWTMASNRGPNAVSPPASVQDSSYYKSRDNRDPAFSWAQKNGGTGQTSGGVGGSWGSVPTAPVPAATSSVASQARQSPYTAAAPAGTTQPSTGRGTGGTAVADGSYEKNLIMELCPPGGMKPVPPPDKLANFSRSVPSLNPDLVCPVLLDLLEEGHPWIMRAKALGVMETCIQHGSKEDTNTNPYADFFYECRAEIEPLTNHPRAAIKDPARRVLKLLGISPSGDDSQPPPAAVASPTASASAQPVATPAAPVANLLDFDTPTAEPAPAPAPASQPVPAAPVPNAGASSSLFGGMDIKGSAPPAATAAPAPPPAPTSGNLLGELANQTQQHQGSSQHAATTATTASTTASMFDQMTIKDTHSRGEEKKIPEDFNKGSDDLTAVAASGGSAFGFINNDNAATTTARATANGNAAAASTVPTKQSFDPLLTELTPNSAKKMMQISPEQMQAMAFQQMMMQQQMQQMQMAMALQQQAGKRGVVPSMGVAPQQHHHHHMVGGIMGGHAPGATSSSFSFLDKPKKEDKRFDFVKDAMKSEKH